MRQPAFQWLRPFSRSRSGDKSRDSSPALPPHSRKSVFPGRRPSNASSAASSTVPYYSTLLDAPPSTAPQPNSFPPTSQPSSPPPQNNTPPPPQSNTPSPPHYPSPPPNSHFHPYHDNQPPQSPHFFDPAHSTHSSLTGTAVTLDNFIPHHPHDSIHPNTARPPRYNQPRVPPAARSVPVTSDLRTSALTPEPPSSLERDQNPPHLSSVNSHHPNEIHNHIFPPDRTTNPPLSSDRPLPPDSRPASNASNPSSTQPPRSRFHYHRTHSNDVGSRFAIFSLRRHLNSSSQPSKSATNNPPTPTNPSAQGNLPRSEDPVFGVTQHDPHHAEPSDTRPGEEVLIRFIRNTFGPTAHNIAVRLMNKTPITSSSSFSYIIHQGTEESDIDIIRRDLTSGRLYASGVRLNAGAWCNLLLGARFMPGAAPRQRHELTYRRSSCSCIVCIVRDYRSQMGVSSGVPQPSRARHGVGSHEGVSVGRESEISDMESTGRSNDVVSSMSSSRRTPTHSAMANFVVGYHLPHSDALISIGGSTSSRELEIGSVVRLNSRASAKLKFTEEVRELFGHLAYTGPISHEEVYRRVTTIGVQYYLYNKGKKERKVYIQGELIQLPLQVGVVKLGTQPMYMNELGSTYCLYRKQIMSIYVGQIVLEGNSLGSFIETGIRYYIGFGEEQGVCAVFPNKTLGPARKLGVNELLLHHHMVDDLEVKCL